MKYYTVIVKLFILFTICYFLSSDNPQALKSIENSLPGIIGSVLGGITAGISVIFGILTALKASNPNFIKNEVKFISFAKNLKQDIQVLIICLLFSIAIPYVRQLGFQFPALKEINIEVSDIKLFSSIELFIVAISFFALIEIINVMFALFQITMKSEKPAND